MQDLANREKSLLSQIQLRGIKGFSAHKEVKMDDTKFQTLSYPLEKRTEIKQAKAVREEYRQVKDQKS